MPYQYILDEITKKSREILGDALTGVYLHGSMAMGCFHADKSDIDLIAVVDGDVSDAQKMRLMEAFVHFNGQAPPKGLEISVVKREHCSPFHYPTPYELHFSPAHLQRFLEDPQDYVEKMKGEDIDLAAHFTVIRKYGIVLFGEKIEDVFAPVPEAAYLDSIYADIEHAAQDILKQPVYMILNLCRTLAFVREGLCLSKEEGGKWGLGHLPPEHTPLVLEAIACYGSERKMAPKREAAVSFAEAMLEWIRQGKEAAGQ